MEMAKSAWLRIVPSDLSAFDGFRYLSTRICPGFFHIILLPREKYSRLFNTIAASHAYLNGLTTYLDLDRDCCYYYSADGSVVSPTKPPHGGLITFDHLKPFKEFAWTDELTKRSDRLTSFGEEANGCLFGDITKGGHTANAEEVRRLAGRQENGVPVGLLRCSCCGRWKGECLDPSPNFENQVMTVHCLCDNNNLCAGCGRLLYDYKLNANYFDDADGTIWHTPGFSAFGHKCTEVLQ